MSYTFPKSEKLCGKLRITNLYNSGKRFTEYPLRITYKQFISEGEVKVLIWAPKSLFKHAVDRNHLRRQMREAYRLQAEPLRKIAQQRHIGIEVAVNYMAKTMTPYSQIERAMRHTIKKIVQRMSEETATAAPKKEDA